MIDLSRSRVGLLAEIDAHDHARGPVHCITDPDVVTGNAHVRLRGSTRADLFPVLKVVLSERFAAVPRPALIRDLLMPLKHALGNASKHGNGNDPAKTVTVDMALTRTGVFIAVTDEGQGFDVGLAVQRLQQQEIYFVNHGIGMRGFDRAASTVSWENGGRTLLLCYRHALAESTTAGEQFGGSAKNADEDAALRRLLDPAWMRTCLFPELPGCQNGRVKLASCQSYLARGPAGDDCGIRYVLRTVASDSSGAEVRILTGRLHADEAAAAADFEAASLLNDGQQWKSLRIPNAVARIPAEPRLVLYDFDPWMNLWQYLAHRDSLQGLQHSAKRVGKALAAVHRSQAALPLARPDSVAARFRTTSADAQKTLERLPGGNHLVGRFQVGIDRIQAGASVGRPRVWTPIHGALGWDCIHYGVDGLFYFYRFETCQQSDPGIDLGGFAADLLRFTLANNDIAAYRICRDDFLKSYNSHVAHPIDHEEIPYYIALAIGERLRDGSAGTAADAQQLLAALDAAAVP